MNIHPSLSETTVGIIPPSGLPPLGCEGGALMRALMTAGVEHELGERGPDKFDCYSMMQLIQWHLFGRVVTSIDVAADTTGHALINDVSRRKARYDWRLNKGRPRHGDAVTMAHVHEPFHVGVYLEIDRGLIAHCASFTGLVCDDSAALRATGWSKITYYSYREAKA